MVKDRGVSERGKGTNLLKERAQGKGKISSLSSSQSRRGRECVELRWVLQGQAQFRCGDCHSLAKEGESSQRKNGRSRHWEACSRPRHYKLSKGGRRFMELVAVLSWVGIEERDSKVKTGEGKRREG